MKVYAASAHQQWATDVLGEDVLAWIHRMHWVEGLTWRTISSALSDKGGPRLTPETLRRWDHFRRSL